MKGINYWAGFGTVFLFIGYYCFKAAFQKNTPAHGGRTKTSPKGMLIVGGIIAIVVGVLLFVKAISII